MWVFDDALRKVAAGGRLVQAFYYLKDATPPDQSQIRAATLGVDTDQANWLADAAELGDLLAILELTRGVKAAIAQPDLPVTQRLQGTWMLESEEQFGDVTAAHDPNAEPMLVVIESHTLRGCFDAPWKPVTWKIEFDNETSPQAMYLTSDDGGKSRKQSLRFRLDGNTLELCFDRRHPERLPVELKTAEQSSAVIWRLRRKRENVRGTDVSAQDQVELSERWDGLYQTFSASNGEDP
jgi:uncharacterized protein (TIGR03067 family)